MDPSVGAGHGTIVDDGSRGGDLDGTLTALSKRYGTYILTSSLASETAREKDGHGIFTKALLDCFEEGGKDGRESLTITDINSFVHKRLTGSLQTPSLTVFQLEGDPIEIGNFRQRITKRSIEETEKLVENASIQLEGFVRQGRLSAEKRDYTFSILKQYDTSALLPHQKAFRNDVILFVEGKKAFAEVFEGTGTPPPPPPPPPKVDDAPTSQHRPETSRALTVVEPIVPPPEPAVVEQAINSPKPIPRINDKTGPNSQSVVHGFYPPNPAGPGFSPGVPNGSTMPRTVSRELVMAVAAELGKMDDTWYAPDIPANKANNARTAMAMPADEGMLVLFDGTIFGSAKQGLSIGVRGLYFKNTLASPEYVSWEEFFANPFYVHQGGGVLSPEMIVGDHRLWRFFGCHEQMSTFLMKLRAKALGL